MKLRSLAAAAVLILAACGADQTPSERAQQLAEDMESGVRSVVFNGEEVRVYTWNGVAVSETPGAGSVWMEDPNPGVPLPMRPLSDFDLEALHSRLETITCDEGQPQVSATVLETDALLYEEGCATENAQTVGKSFLDDHELVGFDEWTPATLDAALSDLEAALGPEAVEVVLKGPQDSIYPSIQMSATASPNEACAPSVTRFGQPIDSIGFGLLIATCDTTAAGTPPTELAELRAFPLADLDGAEILDAMERLFDEMEAVSGFDRNSPGAVTLRPRGDELVLSVPGADSIDGEDRRVPLTRS